MGDQRKTSDPARKCKVLIVDGHPIVRDGLAMHINVQPDMSVCAGASTASGALQAVAAHSPDLMVLGLDLHDSDGLELIKDVKVRYPLLPVLVFTARQESIYAGRALRAGAKGYIGKEAPAETILRAIRAVLRGQLCVSERVGARLLAEYATAGSKGQPGSVEGLSDRELNVFRLIGQGLGTRQIAHQLHLSVKTIEKYRETIKLKLHLMTAAELSYHAFQWAHTGGLPMRKPEAGADSAIPPAPWTTGA